MPIQSNGTFLIDSAIKTQQWEITKGHLRALVAIQGSYSSADREDEPARWQQLQERVEVFIQGIEDDGLHD